jgi:signal transduction histidine kinase/HAMP domain-containing protein/ActR/RegA family two-component response regulator
MRFPISTRIILAITLIASVGLLSMGAIYRGLATVRHAIRDLTEVREPSAAAAYEMELHVAGTAMQVLRHLDAGAPEVRPQVNTHRKDFITSNKNYVRLADTPASKELGAKVGRQYKELYLLGTTLMDGKDRLKRLLPSIAPQIREIDRLITSGVPSTRDQGPDVVLKGVEAMAMEAEIDLVKISFPPYISTRSAAHRTRILTSLKRLGEYLAAYRKLRLDAEERYWAGEVANKLGSLRASVGQMFSIEEKIAADTTRLIEMRAQIQNTLRGELQKVTIRKFDSAWRGADQAFVSVVHTIKFLVPAFILCCVVAAMLLIHLIKSPVRKLIQGTIAVAAGDLRYRIPQPGRDEFGDLARNFNRMVDELEVTTVSKERLEASEEKLKETNRALMVEVRERQQAEEAREGLLVREQAARAEAEAAQRRLAFLAEASTMLATSLDYETTLDRLARTAVPFLADCCFVDLVEREGIRRVAMSCDHPGGDGVAREVEAQVGCTRQALAMGKAQVSGPVAAGGRVHACMSVPLIARGCTLGAITFLSARANGQYGPEDLSLAENLAWRAALAIENGGLYRAVQEADSRKNEFLAMLAHELRNPLGAISNAVHLLDIRDGDNGSRATRDVLERQVRHMARLVDDLLDVSRITRGKVELRKERVNLADVVRHAVLTVRPLINARGHRLSVSLPSEPIWLEADPTRLEQVLANLLNNAAKYTEPGGRIDLLVELVHARTRSAVIRVRDSGIGIPSEVLPHVFDLFAQAERSLDRSQGGLGIGLTLVRSLVEMHGGTVTAHSEAPGRGSEFVVRLPTLPAPAGRVPRLEPPRPGAAISDLELVPQRPPLRILAVDDNVDASETLQEILEQWGHSVQMAHDGPTAIDLALTEEPDIILLDIGLPGMDGYEVARRLRQPGVLPGVLLVALTGYAQAEDRRRSREAGFDEHLVKPVDLATLHDLLETAPPGGEGTRAGGSVATACETDDDA